MASIKMSDLTFGSLNNIQDGNSGESGDRRRTRTTTAMRMAAEAAFSKDTLNNISEFNGVVVSHRLVAFATYQNKTALFNDYLYRANQDEEEAEVKGIDFSSFAYKVYIPELEPRPAPNSNTDPVLVTYPDVYSDISDGAVPLPLGTLVAVKFEDVENLFNPRIVRVVGGPIAIENVSSAELNNIFNSSVPGFVGNYQSDPPGGQGRRAANPDPSKGPLWGTDMTCPSQNGIVGSDRQTGKKLGDGSDWTDFPDNPVSGWCLPTKPGDPGARGTAMGGHTVGISSTYFRGADYKYKGKLSPNRKHGALDFRGFDGRPLYAVDDGVVVQNLPLCHAGTGVPSSAGNQLVILTDTGYYVRYIHLDTPAIPQKNERVKKGQLVAYCGNTGRSGGSHLHFAVNTRNKWGTANSVGQLHPADFYPDEWLLYYNTKTTAQYRDREDPSRQNLFTSDDPARERHKPNKVKKTQA